MPSTYEDEKQGVLWINDGEVMSLERAKELSASAANIEERTFQRKFVWFLELMALVGLLVATGLALVMGA